MEQLFSSIFEWTAQNLYIITALCIILASYVLCKRDSRIDYYLSKLPGPTSVPLMGDATALWRPHHEIMGVFDNWVKQHGHTFRLWIGTVVPYLFTCDVNVVEKIISGSTYNDKGKHDYSLLDSWLGTGLLTAPASKWGPRRKLITPSFHFKILEDFLPIFNEQASIFVNCFQRDGHDIGKVFNMYPYITKCTLDIICETAMGKKINAQTSDSNKEYMEAVNGMCALLLEKNLKPWLRIPGIYHLSSCAKAEKRYLRVLKGLTEKVISERKLERAERKLNTTITTNTDSAFYTKQRKAFLDLLLDTSEETGQLTDADIREEVDTFMFEGHDTTAVNLSWTILLLAMHPDCQKQVQQELDEIFEDEPSRDVTTADITKMKYLESCVKESLRLFPSVPMIMRQITTDLKLPSGNIAPKGTTAIIAIYWLHRAVEHFPNPEKFLPERFSSDSVLNTKRHAFAYIPFSAGPRNCIGQKFALMEEKIVLAKLLREYSIETDETMESLRSLPDIVLRCDNGVHVRLCKRHSL